MLPQVDTVQNIRTQVCLTAGCVAVLVPIHVAPTFVATPNAALLLRRVTTMAASTASAKHTKPISKSHHQTHPSWIAMITECIATTPDGARHGVSRPAIKKFVDSKYHLPMDATTTGHLNRAITNGTHSGNFVLPKGPSGKVKLAPQGVAEIAKENKKPPSRRPVAPKTTKTEAPVFAEEHHLTATPAIRKYRSIAKKARVHVTPIPGRRVPAQNATTKRGGTKPAVTSSSPKTRSATKRIAESKRRRK